MKKFFKVLGLAGVFGAVALGAASCSNVSQSYADKINEKAQDDKKDNEYSYNDVMKKLGKEAIDLTVNDTLLKTGHTGAIVAVAGCKSKEDIQKKLDEGKEVKGIVVTIVADVATAAAYQTITANDVK